MAKRSFACLILLSFLLAPSSAISAPATTALAEADNLSLSQLETKFFGHTYKKESESKRIERLESFVFGASSDRSPLKERLTAVVNSTRLDGSSQPIQVPVLPNSSAEALANAGQARSCVPRALPRAASRANQYRALYPRVTQIEQLLLGQSYESERIEDRLDRLELNSFGKRSLFPDLGSRVDFLSDYSRAFHPAAYRIQEPEIVNISYEPQTATAQHQPFFGVVDQIELLEKNVYGTIRASKTLQRRVDALEESVYGKSNLRHSDELSIRVSRLWVAIKSGSTAQPGKNNT